MRIKIDSGQRHFTIPLPNWMFFSPLSAAICSSASKRGSKYGVKEGISYRDMRILFKELRRSCRYFKGMPLLYVRSKDGEIVEIYL